MRARSHQGSTGQSWFAHRIDRTLTAVYPRRSLILLIVMAVWAMCAVSYGQTLIGSPGASWQTWTPATDLNDNGAPYWDVPWGASGNYGGSQAEKNIGWCLTSTGDCQGIGSAFFAPGAVPFWGMPYDNVNDTGGARDNKVYFHSNGGKLSATLFLNMSANPIEINEFGWFETNSTGTVAGTKHKLFQGSGEPTGTLTPDPVGKTVTFTPTRYYGFYYSDVSEPACPDGTDQPCATPGPLHGCYALSIFTLNDARCTETGGGQGDHDFVVFNADGSRYTNKFWVVGEDPADCTNFDGDCNLTVVYVAPVR